MINGSSQGFVSEQKQDIEHLSTGLHATTALVFSVLGLLGGLYLLPGQSFNAMQFATFAVLAISGYLAHQISELHPIAGRILLLVGPCAAFALGLTAFEGPAFSFTGGLVVIAAMAISTWQGIAAAALCSIALSVLGDPTTAGSAQLIIWLFAAAEWLFTNRLHTTLDWVWESQQRARWLLTQLRANQGELNRVVSALRQATERLQRTGTELAVARVHADEARELKERFAANISHEMRTPLNLILGFSEMMYFTPDIYGDMEWSDMLRRDIHRIYQSSRQLLDLINDVLDLSRIDAAQMPVHKERTDLGEIISEAVSTVSDLVRGRSITIEAHVPPSLPPLQLDRTRIRQVLINLLNNSASFTDHGSIIVRATDEPDQIVVSVQDTGTGINPDELTRVFDEFHQVDMSLRRRKEGAGLGLAISKRFIELHDGHIWVESTVGQGSTFTFTLPKVSAISVPALQWSPHRIHAEYAQESDLIVVDADPAVPVMISRYIAHHRVIAATNLTDAAVLCDQLRPKAVIVNTPPQEELLMASLHQALHVLPSDTPVLLCSLASQSWMALDPGVRAVLTKPVAYDQLTKTIEQQGEIQDILVVDDDRGFVQLVTRYISASAKGYDVRHAYDGVEALLEIRAKVPDLLLLDLVMPDVSGFELLQKARDERLTDRMRIVIITATDLSRDLLQQHASRIILAQADPFRPHEVLAQIQASLDAFGEIDHEGQKPGQLPPQAPSG